MQSRATDLHVKSAALHDRTVPEHIANARSAIANIAMARLARFAADSFALAALLGQGLGA
jgi:hypothetical protein